jgi:hypothetical protein
MLCSVNKYLPNQTILQANISITQRKIFVFCVVCRKYNASWVFVGSDSSEIC